MSGRFDTIKLRNRPLISISSLGINIATATEADSFTALTEQTGSGGDFIKDVRAGTVTFISNPPKWGKKRSFKITYAWGLDRSSTDRKDVMKREIVRELCVLLSVRQVLTAKHSGAHFDTQEDISLESISTTIVSTKVVAYLAMIKERVIDLWASIGVFNVDMGGT